MARCVLQYMEQYFLLVMCKMLSLTEGHKMNVILQLSYPTPCQHVFVWVGQLRVDIVQEPGHVVCGFGLQGIPCSQVSRIYRLKRVVTFSNNRGPHIETHCKNLHYALTTTTP